MCLVFIPYPVACGWGRFWVEVCGNAVFWPPAPCLLLTDVETEWGWTTNMPGCLLRVSPIFLDYKLCQNYYGCSSAAARWIYYILLSFFFKIRATSYYDPSSHINNAWYFYRYCWHEEWRAYSASGECPDEHSDGQDPQRWRHISADSGPTLTGEPGLLPYVKRAILQKNI